MAKRSAASGDENGSETESSTVYILVKNKHKYNFKKNVIRAKVINSMGEVSQLKSHEISVFSINLRAFYNKCT